MAHRRDLAAGHRRKQRDLVAGRAPACPARRHRVIDRDADGATGRELGGPRAAAAAQPREHAPTSATSPAARRVRRPCRSLAQAREIDDSTVAAHRPDAANANAGAEVDRRSHRARGQKRNCTPSWTWSDSGSRPVTLSPAKRPKRAYSRRRPSERRHVVAQADAVVHAVARAPRIGGQETSPGRSRLRVGLRVAEAAVQREALAECPARVDVDVPAARVAVAVSR